MPIEAVKIPQNVYVEDRIIGPVTLKQLFITGIGAGISYALYATATKSGYTNLAYVAVCWSPTLIAAAFAFMKINDLSLFNIILLSIENANKPNIRYWSPHPGISINLITRSMAKEVVDASAKAQTNANKLAEITRQMEKRQEEMNRLSTHDSPNPGATEPVKTRISEGVKHGVYEHEPETAATETAQSEYSAPVQSGRIQTIGLDPEKSIDGIAPVSRFAHLIPSNS